MFQNMMIIMSPMTLVMYLFLSSDFLSTSSLANPPEHGYVCIIMLSSLSRPPNTNTPSVSRWLAYCAFCPGKNRENQGERCVCATPRKAARVTKLLDGGTKYENYGVPVEEGGERREGGGGGEGEGGEICLSRS